MHLEELCNCGHDVRVIVAALEGLGALLLTRRPGRRTDSLRPQAAAGAALLRMRNMLDGKPLLTVPMLCKGCTGVCSCEWWQLSVRSIRSWAVLPPWRLSAHRQQCRAHLQALGQQRLSCLGVASALLSVHRSQPEQVAGWVFEPCLHHRTGYQLASTQQSWDPCLSELLCAMAMQHWASMHVLHGTEDGTHAQQRMCTPAKPQIIQLADRTSSSSARALPGAPACSSSRARACQRGRLRPPQQEQAATPWQDANCQAASDSHLLKQRSRLAGSPSTLFQQGSCSPEGQAVHAAHGACLVGRTRSLCKAQRLLSPATCSPSKA